MPVLTSALNATFTPTKTSFNVSVQGNPALLHQMCAADYADRWPDLSPPSLSECEQFLSAVQMTVEPGGRDVAAVLGDMGFALSLQASSI